MPTIKYHIHSTTQAKIDLQNIDDYISNELLVPASAIKIISSIKRKIKALSLFPESSGVLYGKEKWRQRSVRTAHVKNYTIVYHVNKRTHIVTILHVSYSRRDIEKLLTKR